MEKYKELFAFDEKQNKVIIGTDEAGRGSGVGAVFAAAVSFTNKNKNLIEKLLLCLQMLMLLSALIF